MLKPARPAEHIAFVNTERDCDILTRRFSDSEFVRIALQRSEKTLPLIPPGPKVWVDPGVDGLDHWPAPSGKYKEFIRGFACADRIVDPEFQKKPAASIVRQFVDSVLDSCAALHPAWISVPQLPVIADSTRNKINRELAEATGQWAARNRFGGQFILPLIFMHQSQVNLKTARTPKLNLLSQCYRSAGAHGVWVVDSSLMDQEGSKTLEQSRFPALINLHKELLALLPPDSVIVGGPYWGINLVLWARGLIRYPAVGLGNQYQYHLPGGRLQPGKTRVALACLKRWVVVSQALQSWLLSTTKSLSPVDPAYAEFQALSAAFSELLRGTNREQIARVYKTWFDSIAAVPPAGRALALFQQLSSAYVLGKSLPELPKDEDSARRPERVAQQLMLVCL